MRIVLVHPNYHSGGAEIAGNWPPAWVAYLAGHLRGAGFDDIHFIDAMTNNIPDDELARRLAELDPDVVGTTAITPSIYKAENVLKIASEVVPDALRVIGGIHATFMYKQVLSEAPWIDVIVRGEGEEIFRDLIRTVAEGNWPEKRAAIKGLAYVADDGKIVATPAAPTVKDLDAINPDWSLLEWSKYIYVPLGVRVAIPNMARGCPFTCSFCSQWKFWRDYRVRDPRKVVDEIENLVNNHQVGFFILADEEPTINRKKFIQFCEELIARGLPDKIIMDGINTASPNSNARQGTVEISTARRALSTSRSGTRPPPSLKRRRFNKETRFSKTRKPPALAFEAHISWKPSFHRRLSTMRPPKRSRKPLRAWRGTGSPIFANSGPCTAHAFTPLFQETRRQWSRSSTSRSTIR